MRPVGVLSLFSHLLMFQMSLNQENNVTRHHHHDFSFILKLVEKLDDDGQDFLKILKLVEDPLFEIRKTEKTPALPHRFVLF